MKVSKKTLVLGASTHAYRYSYLAIHKLRKAEHEIVAVGKQAGDVKDVTIQTKAVPIEGIHTVTLYLNPRIQKEYYEYILALKPKRVIFNPGTENPELYDLLSDVGIQIEVACTLVMLATNQY